MEVVAVSVHLVEISAVLPRSASRERPDDILCLVARSDWRHKQPCRSSPICFYGTLSIECRYLA